MAHQAEHESSRATEADDPYDNAFAESFWSRLKAELLGGGCFLSVDDVRTEFFERSAAAVHRMLLQSDGPPLRCENTRRWATKVLNRLRMSITQNLQVECAAKPDHPTEPELGSCQHSGEMFHQLE